MQQAFDEAAIQFHRVHRQIAQVTEARHARAEIIQRETEAIAAQVGHRLDRTPQVFQRHGFGDFEGDLGRRDRESLQQLAHFGCEIRFIDGER